MQDDFDDGGRGLHDDEMTGGADLGDLEPGGETEPDLGGGVAPAGRPGGARARTATAARPKSAPRKAAGSRKARGKKAGAARKAAKASGGQKKKSAPRKGGKARKSVKRGAAAARKGGAKKKAGRRR